MDGCPTLSPGVGEGWEACGYDFDAPAGPHSTLWVSWQRVPAYYRAFLSKFVDDSPSSIVGELTIENGRARFPLSPEAIEAWCVQLPPLKEACQQLLSCRPESHNWQILLEYPIPQVGKRIDAVILTNNLIIVIETKTGEAPTSGCSAG